MKDKNRKIHFPKRGVSLIELGILLMMMAAMMCGVIVMFDHAQAKQREKMAGEAPVVAMQETKADSEIIVGPRRLTAKEYHEDRSGSKAPAPEERRLTAKEFYDARNASRGVDAEPVDLPAADPFAAVNVQPTGKETSGPGGIVWILGFVAGLIALAKTRMVMAERASRLIAARDVQDPSMKAMVGALFAACADRGGKQLEERTKDFVALHRQLDDIGVRHDDPRYADAIRIGRAITSKIESANTLAEVEEDVLGSIDAMTLVLEEILKNPLPETEITIEKAAESVKMAEVSPSEAVDIEEVETTPVVSPVVSLEKVAPAAEPEIETQEEAHAPVPNMSIALWKIFIGAALIALPSLLGVGFDAIEPTARPAPGATIDEMATHIHHQMKAMGSLAGMIAFLAGFVFTIIGFLNLKASVEAAGRTAS